MYRTLVIPTRYLWEATFPMRADDVTRTAADHWTWTNAVDQNQHVFYACWYCSCPPVFLWNVLVWNAIQIIALKTKKTLWHTICHTKIYKVAKFNLNCWNGVKCSFVFFSAPPTQIINFIYSHFAPTRRLNLEKVWKLFLKNKF